MLLGVATGAAAGGATDRVRGFFADVNRIIVDPSYDARPEERLVAVRRLVTDMVDFRHAAGIALGSEWAARTPGDREEFVRLFTTLLETSLFASVGAKARIDGGIGVTYVAETEHDDVTTVATTVLTRSDRALAVDYRLRQRQGRWVVHDVVLEGVSLVENYRAQFQKVMQRSSYEALVGEMRSRTADLTPRPPATTVAAAAAGAPVARVLPDTAALPAPVPARILPEPAMATAPVTAPRVSPAVGSPDAPRTLVAADHRARPEVTDAGPRSAARPPVEAVMSLALADTQKSDAPAAPPKPAATRSVEPAPARANSFWVQVGAFRSGDKAMRVVAALRDQAVSLFTAPNDPLLRVVVGPFASRDAAASKLLEIRARGYEAFISAVAR